MSGKREETAGPVAAISMTRSAWPSFLAAHDALVVAIQERLSKSGLPELSWYDVLWALEHSPEGRLRMHELADAAVIARSNLTRLIDRMEKAGLVARKRAEDDRRGAYATITDDGSSMRKAMWAVYGPAIEELFGNNLSAEENRLLRDLMLRLLNASRDAQR